MLSSRKLKYLLAAAVMTFASAAIQSPAAHAASFSAPLLPCGSVTVPATVANCPSLANQNTLKRGTATINNVGDVTIDVDGAFPPNTIYTVTFVSPDGSSSAPIGSLMTGPKGNGALRLDAFFKFKIAGTGTFLLKDGTGATQFVSGFAASASTPFPDFEPSLVRCADVTVPASLTGCGTDPLGAGFVDFEGDDGDVTIKVHGAAKNVTYSASVLPATGVSKSLGNIMTDGKGNGVLMLLNEFPATTFGSGTLVLQNGTTNEFFGGFKVSEHFEAPAISNANLVSCSEVTDPVLSNCGTDTLDNGSVKVNAAGKLTVHLSGAKPPNTNYEVFFRPLDNTGDTDTTLLVATDNDGNATASKAGVFAPGTIASGSFVLKHMSGTSADQFVAGFEVH